MLPKGLLKEYSQILSWIMRGFDVIAVVTAGVLAYFYKFGDLYIVDRYLYALIISAMVTLLIFPFFHIYESNRTKHFWQYGYVLIQAICSVFLVLACLAFLTKTGELFSRTWFMTWAVSALTFILLFRCSIMILLRIMRASGWNERRVIIIGAGQLGTKLVETIHHALWTGFHIVGIFDDAPCTASICQLPVQKTPINLSAYVADNKDSIDEIWLALPFHAQTRVNEILHELRHETITTRLMLDLYSLDLLNHSICDFAGFPMLNARTTPMIGMNRFIKAIEDRALSFLILFTISPLFLMIAMAVKCSSPGPIFYRQKRVGWNGREFEMLKFRTMPINAEEKTGPVWAKEGEKRATQVGAFLRKTSLDELPQFINVLKGDMSIVGPRPERAVFVEQFKNQIPRYMQKHLVKAGITGWAQVHGWRGNTSLEKRIEYDLFYIENWSLTFDLRIIFLTLFQGFIHKNAY